MQTSTQSDPNRQIVGEYPPQVSKNTYALPVSANNLCQRRLHPPFEKSVQLLKEPAVLPALFRSLVRDDNSSSIRYDEPDSVPTEYVNQEVSVQRLDTVVDSLWLCGIPNNIRPLHRQLSLGRQIIVTEEVGLHLLWGAEQLFLKPIPPFLLHADSHRTYICDSSNADSAYLAAAALGFLASYCRLVIHESDLRIAQEQRLLPSDVTYPQWTAFAKDIVRSTRSEKIAPRYIYGELRLSRVNFVYRFAPRVFPRHLIRGYFWGTNRYSTFLSANLRWILVVFLYLGVTLGALQVVLGTNQGRGYTSLESAGFYVGVISLFVLAIVFVAIFGALVVAIVIRNAYAWHMSKAVLVRERHDHTVTGESLTLANRIATD